MSRLIVDLTSEQHQTIKALAAVEGKSIKEYVLERILPATPEDDEEVAWAELKALLESRIENAKKHGVSRKTVSQITEETLQRLGKI